MLVRYDRATARGVKQAFSDDDLRTAVQNSTSWRGVMKALGYATTNGRLANGLRLRSEALGLDSSHFVRGRTGRTWPSSRDGGGIECQHVMVRSGRAARNVSWQR